MISSDARRDRSVPSPPRKAGKAARRDWSTPAMHYSRDSALLAHKELRRPPRRRSKVPIFMPCTSATHGDGDGSSGTRKQQLTELGAAREHEAFQKERMLQIPQGLPTKAELERLGKEKRVARDETILRAIIDNRGEDPVSIALKLKAQGFKATELMAVEPFVMSALRHSPN